MTVPFPLPPTQLDGPVRPYDAEQDQPRGLLLDDGRGPLFQRADAPWALEAAA